MTRTELIAYKKALEDSLIERDEYQKTVDKFRAAARLALDALEMNPLDTPTEVYDAKYAAAIAALKEVL